MVLIINILDQLRKDVNHIKFSNLHKILEFITNKIMLSHIKNAEYWLYTAYPYIIIYNFTNQLVAS